jgi:hypothetical protein
LEDTLTPLTGTLSHSVTITSTLTSISAADGDDLQVGHIILVDSEQMWVSAVSTNVLTVVRNYGGTQASHDSIAAWTIVGMARLEGADSSGIGYTDRTTGSNYTQIFHKEVKVTRSQTQIQQYGIADEFNYQSTKCVPELMRLVERQLHYGQRKAGSATEPRAFGGYSTFVTTNLIAGTSLTQAMIENAVMSAYVAGGTGPWLAACAPGNVQKIKNFYDSSLFLAVMTDETTVGVVIDSVRTPYGDVNLLLDRWALSTMIPLLDPSKAGFLTFSPFTQEPLAKHGDSVLGEVVGEFTFCLKQSKAHSLLTAVS